MLHPPVLRLSKALYSDAPNHVEGPSRTVSSRKRGHENLTSSIICPSPLRMLLPRTFVHAEHAYHARNILRDTKVGKYDRICTRTSRSTEQSPIVGDNVSTAKVDGGGGMPPSETGATPPRCDATSLIPGAAHSKGSHVSTKARMVVVVESLLGFLAVRSLLEESHKSWKGAGSTFEFDNDSQNRDGLPDRDVSIPVRRLVGWLRLTVAMANRGRLDDNTILKEQHCPALGESPGTPGTEHEVQRASMDSGGQRGRRNIRRGSGNNGPAQAYQEVYAVTRCCDHASGWSEFYLDLAGIFERIRVRPSCFVLLDRCIGT